MEHRHALISLDGQDYFFSTATAVKPQVVTYGAASSACEKGQRWAEVLTFSSGEVQKNLV